MNPSRDKPRAERQAKGINVIDLVKLVRSQSEGFALAGLSPAAQELVDSRIVMTSWYPYVAFDELLAAVHAQLFGGSDEAAVRLGLAGGGQAFGGVHRAFIRAGDPTRSVAHFDRVWSSYFNFASAAAEGIEGGVRITIMGYDDMSRTHGHVVIGWVTAAVELAGAVAPSHRVVASPWEAGAPLQFEVCWKSVSGGG